MDVIRTQCWHRPLNHELCSTRATSSPFAFFKQNSESEREKKKKKKNKTYSGDGKPCEFGGLYPRLRRERHLGVHLDGGGVHEEQAGGVGEEELGFLGCEAVPAPDEGGDEEALVGVQYFGPATDKPTNRPTNQRKRENERMRKGVGNIRRGEQAFRFPFPLKSDTAFHCEVANFGI